MIRGPSRSDILELLTAQADLYNLLRDAADTLRRAVREDRLVGEDYLEDLSHAGEAAYELAEAILLVDTCRCDDPACPCSGEKRGAL